MRGVLAENADAAADTDGAGAIVEDGAEAVEEQPDEAFVDLNDEDPADTSNEDGDVIADINDLPDEVRDGDVGALEPH
jgi:hypothetical protein